MSGTAVFVERVIVGFCGDARLYRLTRPLDQYVIVSAAITLDGPETYIFATDALASFIDWRGLDGSYKGGLDHAQALRNAGYEVTV